MVYICSSCGRVKHTLARSTSWMPAATAGPDTPMPGNVRDGGSGTSAVLPPDPANGTDAPTPGNAAAVKRGASAVLAPACLNADPMENGGLLCLNASAIDKAAGWAGPGGVGRRALACGGRGAAPSRPPPAPSS
eukprot:1088345-Prorocentrum_minimum.AAC.3